MLVAADRRAAGDWLFRLHRQYVAGRSHLDAEMREGAGVMEGELVEHEV